jgi:hypothetical protein
METSFRRDHQHQHHRHRQAARRQVCLKFVALRASVGSNESSDGRSARVGLIDRSIEQPPCARRCERTDARNNALEMSAKMGRC